MARRDIQAGAAYIRLYLRNSALKQGLRDGLADVAKFSAGMIAALQTEKVINAIKHTISKSLRLGADEEMKGLWTRFEEATNAALGRIGAIIIETFDLKTKLETATAVSGAIAAGKFSLIGQLAMESLNAAILAGLAALSELMGEAWGDILGTLSTNSLQENWELGLSGMAAYWDAFVAGITDVFTNAANAIIQVWQKVTSWIADKILENQRRLKDFLDLVGLGEKLLGPDVAPADLAQAKEIARAQIGSTASSLQAALEERRKAASDAAIASSSELGERLAGGRSAIGDAAAKSRAEIERLMAEVKAAAESRKKPESKIAAPDPDTLSKASSLVTYSATQLANQGGGSIQARMLKVAEDAKAIDAKALEEAKLARRGIERIGMGLTFV